MPRKHRRKLGARHYLDYDKNKIEEALEKIVEDNWSIRRAAREYNIPYGTLYNRFNGQHVRQVGHPTIFTENEEKAFIKAAATCGEWGYPLSKADLQWLAKNYADSKGRIIPHTINNKPGIEWVDSILKRHRGEITCRVAANIKRSRAAVSPETIQSYFANLERTIENVPPTNLFNYDETNVGDDPGKSKKLFKRGTKYPEQVCNFTKSATTIMVCVSASGVLLPPYIIYRAEKMWNTWTKDGPKGYPCCDLRCCKAGSRYNRTKHGWMDAATFTDWFNTIFLPHAKNLEGKKVILGDNLAAHFTEDVLRACEENNIAFACLPPNSTHLTQPLDVGFFRPLKMAWRSTVLKWKERNPNAATIQKDEFPKLLQKTLIHMDEKALRDEEAEQGAIKRNAISSFEATGICPFNPNRVMKRLPGYEEQEEVQEEVSSSLVSFLKTRRYGDKTEKSAPKKKKDLKVQPGRSVNAVQENETSESDEEERGGETSTNQVQFSEEESEQTFKVGDYVEVRLQVGRLNIFKHFLGVITEEIDDSLYNVNFLRKKSGKKQTYFYFPDVKDESVVRLSEVINKVGPPHISRGKYVFCDVQLQILQ